MKRKNIKDIKVNICCVDNVSYRHELEEIVKSLNMQVCSDISTCNLFLVGERHGVSDFMENCILIAKHLDKLIIRYNIKT